MTKPLQVHLKYKVRCQKICSEQLKENFPVLKKFKDIFELTMTEENDLLMYSEETSTFRGDVLTQQDCLEISQLFALLATAFEEVNKND